MQTALSPQLAAMARLAAAEGAVLLKNTGQVLPLRQGQAISLFGRTQHDYYKSGTGSGGMVHAPYTVSILEGLRENPHVLINESLAAVYTAWCRNNPPVQNPGEWASDPWSQEEMPLTQELVDQAAGFSDTAVVVIGRTAGEDRDALDQPGSFRLADGEIDMLRLVTKTIPHVIVLLNTGHILDMSWMDAYPVDAVLYVWQGGMEGGRAVADLLTGQVPACGRLCDTIAYSYRDYPSSGCFGAEDYIEYQEDIYVGYRYFETFAPRKVRYPFGFGLSYTRFTHTIDNVTEAGGQIAVTVTVTNTGSYDGKEVVQIYHGAPQGVLGKPLRSLAGFAKTAQLSPGQSQTLTIRFSIAHMASYDDAGKTGRPACYVLEPGEYPVYVGTNARDVQMVYTHRQDALVVTQTCQEALAVPPGHGFSRLIALFRPNGELVEGREPVPVRTIDPQSRINENRPLPLEANQLQALGWQDIAGGTASLEDLIAQLPLEDLARLCCGEGMNSPKVTAGTASAFGGLTDSLQARGIPVGCCADGPSGIRMDSGELASSLPIGTLMACTWNLPLIEQLHRLEGEELLANRIDCWLAPGMNIHRNPLCGRNFEYFSEDPLLTGMMACAVIRGVQSCGVCATPKHFAANNQEHRRHDADSRVSQRALREIYLKGFEIAVKAARPAAVMTSYNPINGRHAACCYDLTTLLLRGEWGFDGMVMTDWWAKKDADGMLKEEAAMVQAQNDIAMPVGNDASIREAVAAGGLTLGEVQRCALHVLQLLARSPAGNRAGTAAFDYRPGPDWFAVDVIPGG